MSNQPVPVRVIRGKLYPCLHCKYKTSEKVPSTMIHFQQQRRSWYLLNSNTVEDQGFADTIGECSDFVNAI